MKSDVYTKEAFLKFFQEKIRIPIARFTDQELPEQFDKINLRDFPFTQPMHNRTWMNSFFYVPHGYDLKTIASISITTPGNQGCTANCHVFFLSVPSSGMLRILLGGNDITSFCFSSGHINMHQFLWNGSNVVIGKGTSCNNARLEGDNFTCTFGQDCMLADEVTIQGSNQHGIIHADNLKLKVPGNSFTHLGRHVWLGRKTLLLKNIELGDGTIVGAGTVVNKSCGPFSVLAGNPCHLVKTNTTWSRFSRGLIAAETKLIHAIKADLHLKQQGQTTETLVSPEKNMATPKNASEKELLALRTENNNLTDALAKQADAMATLEKDNIEKKNRIVKLEADGDPSGQERRKLGEEILARDKRIAALEQTQKELLDQINQLNDVLSTSQREKKSLEETCSHQKNDIQYLQNMLNTLAKEILTPESMTKLCNTAALRTLFDGAKYLAINADVQAALEKGLTPSALYHWIFFGLKEKRRLV